MWNAANLAEQYHDYNSYGFNGTSKLSFSLSSLKQKRDSYISRLNKIYENNLKNSNVTLFRGDGSFLSNNQIIVGDQIVSGDKILIATGGHPFIPSISGAEHGITRLEI